MKPNSRQTSCLYQNNKIKNSIVITTIASLCFCAADSPLACGPDFPNNLLDQGDAAVLHAPHTDFFDELVRMRLYRYQDPVHQTDSELSDLTAVLKKKTISPTETASIYEQFAKIRQQLDQYHQEAKAREASRPWVFDANGSHPGEPQLPEPGFPSIILPVGLPDEFALYLEGAKIWRNQSITNKSAAREAWAKVLTLPEDQRRFKSTWAAYMLGRFWEKEDPEKAVEYYQKVRDLAHHGFIDSANLSTESIGWEARQRFKQGNLELALELYLKQLGAGDGSAVGSLQLVIPEALASPLLLPKLAKNPRVQRVITAYLSSMGNPNASESYLGSPEAQSYSPATIWLEAVEKADIADVDSAEKLALAAYQNNQPAIAQRWLKRAGNSPLADWIRVKLLLRAGKIDAATALLTRVVDAFPLDTRSIITSDSTDLADNLSVGRGNYPIQANRAIRGELGVLHLSRREYIEALDCLIQTGVWMDAAYVAERVLSIDELKNYVDNFCPAASALSTNQLSSDRHRIYSEQSQMRRNLRYLLARRLMRNNRGDEARPYYPDAWVPNYDNLVQSLRDGWNESLPSASRASALRTAAFITRTNGIELLGTEVEPDWAVYDGQFEGSLTWQSRSTNSLNAKIVPAGREEIIRASHRNPDPDERFHYRYQAAFLGWSAAGLMPTNTDECAGMLCVAGTWLKHRDPDTADLFYKALVWRNRATSLGQEADRKRWFPAMDIAGNRIVTSEGPAESDPPQKLPDLQEDPDSVTPELKSLESDLDLDPHSESLVLRDEPNLPPNSRVYIVRGGDTLARIARALSLPDYPVTALELKEANALSADRLRIGQKILVPFREVFSED